MIRPHPYALVSGGSTSTATLTGQTGTVFLYLTLDDASHPLFFRLVRIFN